MSDKKILVIDDEQSIIYSIQKALKNLPYELQTAENGLEAIEKLKTYTPDLLILDLSMPRMNGIEFLKEINLKPTDPYAVIILTGHGDENEMRQCYNLGAHFFVRKPFGITDLTCLVERCMTFKELERDSQEYRSYLEQSVESQNEYISKLSLALDKSATSIIMSDSQRQITYINSSYAKVSGFDLLDLQGKDILSIFSSDNSLLFEEIKNHLDEGLSWKGELFSVHKSEKNYWVTTTITPIKNNAGELTNYIIIQDDISVQKEAQQEKERSIELAEQHRQTKQNFCNNIGHELLTPLHIITTATSIFDSLNVDPSLKKYIGYIQRASEDIISRVTMILDMKRVEDDEITPRLNEFSIQKLFSDIAHSYTPYASEKKLELTYYLDKNLPEHVVSDEMMLCQILSYLIDNAIKFTEKGYVTINAKTDISANSLRIDITDTGIGIPDSKLETIFESFVQGDGSTSRAYSGFGLGLTLAQRLAQTLNGTISIKSALGKGSVFTLTLPLITDTTPSN